MIVVKTRKDWILEIFWKVKPTGFPEESDIGYEGKSNGSKVFGLIKWDKAAIKRDYLH